MSVARHNLKRRSLGARKRKNKRKAIARLSGEKREEWHTKQKYKTVIKAPANLAFLEDPNSTAHFISKIENALETYPSLYVDMHAVEKVDYPTIAAMLAVLYRTKKNGQKINGNKPDSKVAKEVFNKSGFLFTLFSENPEVGHRHDINADNQLFTLDTRDLAIVSEIQLAVARCVAGKEKKLPGLYTTLGELMDNTATHASQDESGTERWWVSINYERSSKKVVFVFVDYGVGIFKSLEVKSAEHPVKKTFEKAIRLFGLTATDEHLRSIVTESARTAYKLGRGRGEGIYGIYQAMKRGELQNLHILSNDAFGDVSAGRYQKLGTNLNGTLYYWEIQGIKQV